MKIRTDFVTNSSSSSFITITFEMKDGTMLTNQSEIENVGKMGVLVYMPDEEIINRIKTRTAMMNCIRFSMIFTTERLPADTISKVRWGYHLLTTSGR